MVSIRAPPAWRGRLTGKVSGAIVGDVSIRAPPAWRGRPQGLVAPGGGGVSIRAPPAWRGRRFLAMPNSSLVSFNPRPPRLEGATCGYGYRDWCRGVSIRAPPAWRGRLPLEQSRDAFVVVSIRAPPAWRGRRVLQRCPPGEWRVSIRAPPAWRGRLPSAIFYAGVVMFQSAPPPLGGGDTLIVPWARASSSFNPRPPRLEGATSRQWRTTIKIFQ